MTTRTRTPSLILTAPQVRAALAGRLEQVRVSIKLPARFDHNGDVLRVSDRAQWVEAFGHNDGWRVSAGKYNCWSDPFHCPFGQVGGRIVGKETWSQWGDDDDAPLILFKSDKSAWLICDDGVRPKFLLSEHAEWNPLMEDEPIKWRGANTLPTWAARLHFELTSIRVERASDMSARDAWLCGVRPEGVAEHPGDGTQDSVEPQTATLEAFKADWLKRHGDGAWGFWTWVLGVRRVEG